MTRSPDERNAIETVTRYLRLVEERRLDEASRYLAPDPVIVFPGGRRFSDLDEQVASSRGRYRRVTKTIQQLDVFASDRSATVYVSGDLEGEDLAGRRFSSVRFIDRLELDDGLVVTHHVWNDLAERMANLDAGSDRENGA